MLLGSAGAASGGGVGVAPSCLAASSLGGGGAVVSGTGLGLGLVRIGVEKYTNSSRFFLISSVVTTGGWLFGFSACRASWSSNHFWVVAAFSTTDCSFSGSMCEYLSSPEVACDMY